MRSGADFGRFPGPAAGSTLALAIADDTLAALGAGGCDGRRRAGRAGRRAGADLGGGRRGRRPARHAAAGRAARSHSSTRRARCASSSRSPWSRSAASPRTNGPRSSRSRPRLRARFRWAGTDTLIFTPADPKALPYATRFDVAVDTTATSVAGRRLARPHTFSFTTPTVRLLRTNWYRKNRRYDCAARRPPALQPARHARGDRSRTSSLRYQPHPFEAPILAPESAARARRGGSARERGLPGQGRARGGRGRQLGARARSAHGHLGPEGLPASTRPARLGHGRRAAARRVDPRPARSPARAARRATSRRGSRRSSRSGSSRRFSWTASGAGRAATPTVQPAPPADAGRGPRARPRAAVLDVTDPAKPAGVPRRTGAAAGEDAVAGEPAYGEGGDEGADTFDHAGAVALEDAGFTLRPARSYRVTVDRAARSVDGQTLGYTWVGPLENWHRSAFTSFGAGHGVWESRAARCCRSMRATCAPPRAGWRRSASDELMPTLRRLAGARPSASPRTGPAPRSRSGSAPDRLSRCGLDLKRVLSPAGTGLVWAALQDGPPIARALPRPTPTAPVEPRAGHQPRPQREGQPAPTRWCSSRGSTTAQPVAGARVAIRDLDNQVRVVRHHRRAGHRHRRRTSTCATTRTGGGSASSSRPRRTATSPTSASDWHEGIEPWMFGLSYDLDRRSRCCAAACSPTAACTRLGEEVHFKAILRSDTRGGHARAAGGDRGRDRRCGTARARRWTSARSRSANGAAPTGRSRCPRRARSGTTRSPRRSRGSRSPCRGWFLVAAYRRPEFRVDANLAGESSLAGVSLKGVVSGRYLFGAPMAGQRRAVDVHAHAGPDRARRRCASGSPTERWRVPRRGLDGLGRVPRTGTLQTADGDARRRGPARARPRDRPRGRASPASTRSRARSPTSRARRSPAARRSASTRRPGTSASSARRYFGDVGERPRHRGRGGRRSDGTPVAGVPVQADA